MTDLEYETTKVNYLFDLKFEDTKLSSIEMTPIYIKDAKEAEDVFKEKTPYITYILIAINVIMFILVSIFSAGKDNLEALVRFGALNKTLVVNLNSKLLTLSINNHQK